MIVSGGELLLDAGDSYYGSEHIAWGQGMVAQGIVGPSRDRSMRLSAVFACLRLLSEAICALPLDTFTKIGETRKSWPTPDYLLFEPPQESRIDYLSQVMLSLLTDGNAYVLTPRDVFGTPTNLVVLDPYLMNVTRVRGVVEYRCQGIRLDPRTDLLHIKGMTLPGHFTGLSPLSYARETIRLGLNAQGFGSSFFENGALPGAIIETDGDMSQPAIDRFKATWNGSHEGVGNAHRVGVLTGGAKLSKVSIAPNDAQFLETNQFQVPQIARFYGVPPHLIADASNSTSWGSGLAEQNTAFGQFAIRGWQSRIEEGHTRLLHSHANRRTFVKLNLAAMLEPTTPVRYETYKTAIEARFMTINEARALEDMAPVPWGDEPFVVERVTETGPAPTTLPGLPAGPSVPPAPTNGHKPPAPVAAP